MATALRPKSAAAAVALAALPLPLHMVARPHHSAKPRTAEARPKAKKPQPPAPTKTTATTTAPAATTPGANARSKAASNHRLTFPRARVHHGARAAGDPGDTISDYKFTPGTLTIHAGDTVTWTNSGPSAHSATADNHSFDTGLISKGASASHTFTQAGTVTYFCSIHPFMHGTIVVLAATTTPSTTTNTTPSSAGQSNNTATTTTTTTPVNTSSGGLPNTGLDLVASLLSGLAFVVIGLGLRRIGSRYQRSGADTRSGR